MDTPYCSCKLTRVRSRCRPDALVARTAPQGWGGGQDWVWRAMQLRRHHRVGLWVSKQLEVDSSPCSECGLSSNATVPFTSDCN